MKVTVICSSPRKNGNSEVLADAFIKGAQDAGHEVTKLSLRDYKINPCLSCEYCRNHNKQCIQKDDANQVIESVIQSDVFVFAAPMYFYSLPGQLKILIDRFFAREYEIREAKKRKKAYLIYTSATPVKEDSLALVESFRGFIRVLRTVDEGGIIYGTSLFNKGDANNNDILKEAYNMGKAI